ncbi:MAG TPA: Rrf2 family transcriptional regulator [Acidimicrobiales bacterium]|nr:Rrf2 family transcriptional regulator [Acidimicrobiales bacterium]
MHISAKVDYALRALVTLAASEPDGRTADQLADSQGLPVRFLRSILDDLRRARIVTSQRGTDGGYHLARPASEITIGEVVRRLDGPLADIRGMRPESATYEGPAVHLQEVWVAVRACLRDVVDKVTIADVTTGNLPKQVKTLLAKPDAWQSR